MLPTVDQKFENERSTKPISHSIFTLKYNIFNMNGVDILLQNALKLCSIKIELTAVILYSIVGIHYSFFIQITVFLAEKCIIFYRTDLNEILRIGFASFWQQHTDYISVH